MTKLKKPPSSKSTPIFSSAKFKSKKSKILSRFSIYIPYLTFRNDDKVKLSWFVNTNEDVGGFRLELRSSGIPQTTLFSKELPYDSRSEVIQVSPEFGDDWTMCVLVENSAGRLRRWKSENCRKASLISSAVTNSIQTWTFVISIQFITIILAAL